LAKSIDLEPRQTVDASWLAAARHWALAGRPTPDASRGRQSRVAVWPAGGRQQGGAAATTEDALQWPAGVLHCCSAAVLESRAKVRPGRSAGMGGAGGEHDHANLRAAPPTVCGRQQSAAAGWPFEWAHWAALFSPLMHWF